MAGVDKCNLIINYLPPAMSEAELRALFEPHGEIAHLKIVMDRAVPNKSLGFGFVKYSTEAQAAAAIEAKNGLQIGTKKIKVSISRPPTSENRESKLYVSQLPEEFTEDDIKKMFQQYGTVAEVRLLVDHTTNQSRCTAFVQMDNKAEALAAISALHDSTPPGGSRSLVVRVSDSAKRRRNQGSFAQMSAMGGGMGVQGGMNMGGGYGMAGGYGMGGFGMAGGYGMGGADMNMAGGYGPMRGKQNFGAQARYDPMYGGGMQGMGTQGQAQGQFAQPAAAPAQQMMYNPAAAGTYQQAGAFGTYAAPQQQMAGQMGMQQAYGQAGNMGMGVVAGSTGQQYGAAYMPQG
eukprot:CAMPEP_0113939174 /NCGR_PEP_ID=MMETSP1339-20121228/5530_1 /TAXON_ID=94617 /ORGANISM="Fibrocapsa japonica" /LENGTH=346 /DNA_ID=CAMNT_0000942597 /DNA_START=84 /DNA_END=1124 /DNA_ORIENTATION=- /assembly_acc=CAM_ASM_000762